jgi:hypothetical protein
LLQGYKWSCAAYAWSHTATPMLSGTLVTIIGLMPVGFAKSTAGEYAGNIFRVVGFALIVSWFVAVTFTPADPLGVLRVDGLYPDRWNGSRHGDDPALPCRPLRCVVPDQTTQSSGGRRNGRTSGATDGAGAGRRIGALPPRIMLSQGCTGTHVDM